MRIVSVLMLALACAACSSDHELTSCRGTLTAANPGHWTPTPADLSLKAVVGK